jgi:hypothetical protein
VVSSISRRSLPQPGQNSDDLDSFGDQGARNRHDGFLNELFDAA